MSIALENAKPQRKPQNRSPEGIARRKKREKARRIRDAEAIKAYQKEYRKNNPRKKTIDSTPASPEKLEKNREYHKQWRANNPERFKAAQKRYRQKKKMKNLLENNQEIV